MMKINLGGFSGKFYAFEFKAESASIEVDFYEVLSAFLNSELPTSVRKKAEETLEKFADEACPLDPEYNTWLAVDKTQAYEDLYGNEVPHTAENPESEAGESSDDSSPGSNPGPELQVETNCNAPGVEIGNLVPGEESCSQTGKEPGSTSKESSYDSDLWERYKTNVLAPLLEQTLVQCTTKAALKAADNRIKDLRKCLSISLSPKFDEDFLEQMYLAKSKIYGNNVPSPVEEPDSTPSPELQSETNCNTPGVKTVEESPRFYVLRENQHLIPKGGELSSYTIVDNVLEIPSKTCQYLDENGELGEAVYVMAQARKDIRDGKQAFRKATEDENKALLEVRLKAIAENPDYTPEEKENRSRNAKARFSITDFSKV